MPTAVPSTTDMKAAETPTKNATLAPASSWLKMSRPMKSVPSQCCQLGPTEETTLGSTPVMGWYMGVDHGRDIGAGGHEPEHDQQGYADPAQGVAHEHPPVFHEALPPQGAALGLESLYRNFLHTLVPDPWVKVGVEYVHHHVG